MLKKNDIKDFCSIIPMKLSKAHRDIFYHPLSLKDLKTALSHMANEKAPRIDGFPYEFYKIFWDLVGSYLIQVYNEAMATSSLGQLKAISSSLPSKEFLISLPI